MTKSNLDVDGHVRLEKVLCISRGNIANLDTAVREVLSDLRGPATRGRRIYLQNELTRRAKRRIGAWERAKEGLEEFFNLCPAKRLDAWRHEQSLLNGVPEHDR